MLDTSILSSSAMYLKDGNYLGFIDNYAPQMKGLHITTIKIIH